MWTHEDSNSTFFCSCVSVFETSEVRDHQTSRTVTAFTQIDVVVLWWNYSDPVFQSELAAAAGARRVTTNTRIFRQDEEVRTH